jgi:hypothetical protein
MFAWRIPRISGRLVSDERAGRRLARAGRRLARVDVAGPVGVGVGLEPSGNAFVRPVRDADVCGADQVLEDSQQCVPVPSRGMVCVPTEEAHDVGNVWAGRVGKVAQRPEKLRVQVHVLVELDLAVLGLAKILILDVRRWALLFACDVVLVEEGPRVRGLRDFERPSRPVSINLPAEHVPHRPEILERVLAAEVYAAKVHEMLVRAGFDEIVHCDDQGEG